MSENQSNEIISLIRRYGIVIIFFYLFNQFLLQEFLWWVTTWLDVNSNSFEYKYGIALSTTIIVLNTIVALITLYDTRSSQLRWLIFFVTLMFPVAGIVFLIIEKLVKALTHDSTEIDETLVEERN